MGFFDAFEPYSPESGEDLEEYLRSHDGISADTLFYGPECFFMIKERGLLIPGGTALRVSRSPLPDIIYFVNEEFMLEGRGPREPNMSAMGAEKGIYDPDEVLKEVFWSIHGLDLWKEED